MKNGRMEERVFSLFFLWENGKEWEEEKTNLFAALNTNSAD